MSFEITLEFFNSIVYCIFLLLDEHAQGGDIPITSRLKYRLLSIRSRFCEKSAKDHKPHGC